MAKKVILDLIQAISFFFNNLALLATRYHGQLSSYTISEKTNDLTLRTFIDGQIDGNMDEPMKKKVDRKSLMLIYIQSFDLRF